MRSLARRLERIFREKSKEVMTLAQTHLEQVMGDSDGIPEATDAKK